VKKLTVQRQVIPNGIYIAIGRYVYRVPSLRSTLSWQGRDVRDPDVL
jgi:hypothetical protein